MVDAVATKREISLGGWRFPILDEPRRVEIARFPAKLIAGDVTESNEQNASAYVMKDFTGGLGVKEMDESSQGDRFWFALAETMRSKWVGLPPYAHDCGGADTHVLAQYANEVYRVGSTVQKWNDNSESWGSSLHSITGMPTDWIEYADTLFIARGDDGYTTFDGATWTDVAGTTEKAECFGIHDGKLFKIDSTGALKYTTDGSSWTPLLTMTHPSGSYRGLFEYVNLSGDPALHVVHNRGIDYVDVVNAKAYRSGLQLPKHPQGGRGARVWRGDMAIYFAGLTGYSYIPGNIRLIGLDREDGVPVDLRGNIIDLADGHYAIFAALDNTSAAAPPESGYTTRFAANAPKVGSQSLGFSTVLAYNGTGWHPIWQSGSQEFPIRCLLLSDAYSAYRLWFAANERVYYIKLPLGVYNPMESADSEYAASGVLITPWMDGNMAAEPKTALELAIRTRGLSSTETVTISYGLDGSEGWTQLGQYTTDNPEPYRFGGGLGLKFYQIRFKFELARGSDINKSPWFIAKFRYRRSLPKLWGWECRVDCRAEYRGHTPKQLVEKLIALADPEDKLLVPFSYKYRTPAEYYVEVSIAGQELTGPEEGGIFTVRLAELG